MAMTSNYVWQEQTHRMPCNCGCPDCDNPIDFNRLLTLVVGDDGKCYSSAGSESGEIYVYLPSILAMNNPWCVSIKTTNWTIAVIMPPEEFVIPPENDFYNHIYIDGVPYDGVYVSGLSACFCFDGEKFVATGDVMGYNSGPG